MKTKTKFSTKILLIVISAMVLLAVAYVGVFFMSVSTILGQQANDANISAINGYGEQIQTYQENIDFVSRVIVADENLKSSLDIGSEVLVQNSIQTHLYNTDAPIVAVYNSYGELMMSSDEFDQYADQSFNEPLAVSVDGQISTAIVKGNDGMYYVLQTTPIRNKKQKVVGILYLGFLLNDEALLNELGVKYSTQFISLNETNVLTTSIDNLVLDESVFSKLVSDDEIGSVVFEESNIDKTLVSNVSLNETSYNSLFKTFKVDNGKPLVIVSMQDRVAFTKAMVDITLISTSVGLGFILIATIGLVIFLKKRVSNPLEEMTNAAINIKNGRTDVTVNVINSNDEFELITRTFSELVSDINHKSEAIKKIAVGDISNVYVDDKSGEDTLAKNINLLTQTISSISDATDIASLEVLMGSLSHQMDTTNASGKYKELVRGVNSIVSSFESHLSKMPIAILTIDKEKRVHFANEHANKYCKDIVGNNIDEAFNFEYDGMDAIENTLLDGNPHNVHIKSVPTRIKESTFIQLITSPLMDNNDQIVGSLIIAIDETEVKKIENKLQKQSVYQSSKIDQLLVNISKLSQGDFKMEFEEMPFDEDTEEVKATFEVLEKTMTYSVSMIDQYVQTITETLEKLAEGNLDVKIDIDFVGDFSPIKNSLEEIIESMNDLAFSIRQSASNVMIGANNQTSDAEELSKGTTEQASAIEEISATVTEVSAQVKESAGQIEEVTEHAKLNRENALMSDHRMRKLEDSMDDINKATEQIQSVLKLINDIAFQTNILSLNAAVEAARAGSHGKGFAVIAEDVRNLALKSSDAANETEEMIKKVLSHVQEGMKNAKDTAQSMKEIFNGAKKVNKLAKAIKRNSTEQTTAISQIDLSLDQISTVVQGAQLSAQKSLDQTRLLLVDAEEMVKTSDHFKLREDYRMKLISSDLVQTGRMSDSFSKDELVNTVDDEESEVVINLELDEF